MIENNQTQETDDFNFDDDSSSAGVFTLESLIAEANQPAEVKDDLVILDTPEAETKDDVVVPLEIEDEPEVEVDSPEAIEKIEKSNKYKDAISILIKSGDWEPVDTLISEDGNEVPLDEVEIDEEIFTELTKQQNAVRKEKLLANKIDVTNTSEFTKKLIEIEKNGGNVRQAIEAFTTIQEPLSQVDTTTEKGQIEVIVMELKATNVDDDAIPAIIDGYKSKGVLEEKAQAVETRLKKAFDEHIDAINQKAIKDREAEKERVAEYKKGLKENINKSFQLNDVIQRKLVDAATKKNEQGFYELDRIYNEKRKNPQDAADITLFLLDKEEYLKQKFSEYSTNKELKTFQKFSFTKKGEGEINLKGQGNKEGVHINQL